ncbi:IS3 family transposase [Peribacillus sp. NPDC097225]|uniref:IS3 family transposase n=1 Tax=Peribacillus sp. NPDC097225 TaxID=3364400 RepID=UPI00381B980E
MNLFMPNKKKEVNHVQYQDFHTAKLAMFQFIEGWYNRKRIHSSLEYQTPQAIENQIRNPAINLTFACPKYTAGIL